MDQARGDSGMAQGRCWGYSLRTRRYRYTEWLNGQAGREL